MKKVKKLSKKSILSKPSVLVFVITFAVIGSVLLWNTFAATANTSFSGKLSTKQTSSTYNLSTSASGTLNATASLSRLKSADLELLNSSGLVLSRSSGANPTLSVPVGVSAYTLRISSSQGSGTYKITVNYPVADPTPTLDTTPPSAPANLTAVPVSTSQINLTWQSSTDNIGVSGYDILRNGVKVSTSVTTNYSDVNLTPSTAYGYTVQAIDSATNRSALSNSANATTLTPQDTAPPTVNINTPVNGATVNGSVTASGLASDNSSISKVEIQIDNNGYVPTNGTSSWTYNWNSGQYVNGAHTLSVRAFDPSGNQAVSTINIIINNLPAAGSVPPDTQGTWTSPEGTIISVNSTGTDPATAKPWTIAGIYIRLRNESASPADFAQIAPHIEVSLQDEYPSSTGAGASSSGGVYTSYSAIIRLKGVSSSFASLPDSIMAHEYGHAWTLYHHYMEQNGDWNSYLSNRWVNSDGSQKLLGWPYLDTSYNTSKLELVADDYRMLFGTANAVSGLSFISSSVLSPRLQPNLKDWFINNYAHSQ